MAIIFFMGCVLRIQTFDGATALPNIVFTAKDAINASVPLCDADGNAITPFTTNATGICEAYISAPFRRNITIEATHNGIATSFTVQQSQIIDGAIIPVILNFSAAPLAGAKTMTISGNFIEYPFHNVIQQINGKIKLEFKCKKSGTDKSVPFEFNISNKHKEIGNQTHADSGINCNFNFYQGSFSFYLEIPADVTDLDNGKVKITHKYNGNNVEYTHKADSGIYSGANNKSHPASEYFNPNTFKDMIVIPFYHEIKDYEFKAKLEKFNSTRIAGNGPINFPHSFSLSFNHFYTRADGSIKKIYHKLDATPAAAVQTLDFASETHQMNLEYSFNAPNYAFKVINFIGEIQEAELKINYGGFKSHTLVNGHPNIKFDLKPSTTAMPDIDKIPQDVNGNRIITVPLNGWTGKFEIVTSRENKTPLNIPFETGIIKGDFITHSNKDFNNLQFKIKESTLKYNDSPTDIGIILNIYVCDSNLMPIIAKMSQGVAKTRKKNPYPEEVIHSVDFSLSQNTYGLFFPLNIDPLHNKIIKPKNVIIKPPISNSFEIIEFGMKFADGTVEHPIGTYYVLAEAVPVHYFTIGNNVEIDSIGKSEITIYKIDLR